MEKSRFLKKLIKIIIAILVSAVFITGYYMYFIQKKNVAASNADHMEPIENVSLKDEVTKKPLVDTCDQIYDYVASIEIVNEKTMHEFIKYFKYDCRPCSECSEMLNKKTWEAILLFPAAFVQAVTGLEKEQFHRILNIVNYSINDSMTIKSAIERIEEVEGNPNIKMWLTMGMKNALK